MSAGTAGPQEWITTLRDSQDRLAKLVGDLDADQLAGRSYDTDWTIAQVLSHLGSQAEIFTLFLEAGLSSSEVPGIEDFHPVWDAWNARGPVEVRDDSVAANERLIVRLEDLDPAQMESFRLALFGTDLDLSGYARMRLSEHAVHSWDVAVALDPTATVADDSVRLLLDSLAALAARVGKAGPEPFRVRVATSDPVRTYLLTVTDAVSLEPADSAEGGAEDGTEDGAVHLPAEAFLRLVYGRLDPAHTPELTESGSRGVADLRAVFPGI
jgi:uncharacterized protein (TIGR03083 family)